MELQLGRIAGGLCLDHTLHGAIGGADDASVSPGLLEHHRSPGQRRRQCRDRLKIGRPAVQRNGERRQQLREPLQHGDEAGGRPELSSTARAGMDDQKLGVAVPAQPLEREPTCSDELVPCGDRLAAAVME